MAVKPRPRIVLLECAAPGEAEQGAPDLYLQACLPSDDRALGRFGQKKKKRTFKSVHQRLGYAALPGGQGRAFEHHPFRIAGAAKKPAPEPAALLAGYN